ncbi:GNAT family N-acetyltransferase [Cupriavidus plantarum]|uniref:GNAT family N-acetyltransferase n=1 Tax=Cupriavidus plantarum TaxID=942865 RepID=UPI000E25E82A|nr:GNAT family N-acetyltransferase [Cupriavidus plantarum]
MSEFVIRRMTRTDLAGVVAVQAQCYGDGLIESEAALASRIALSPQTCWIALEAENHDHDGARFLGYLLTHPWTAASLPPWNGQLQRDWPEHAPLVWFIHDMAVAPAGRGMGIAMRLYEAAHASALEQGWETSRLIAVQSAAPWWRRLGYAPIDAQNAYAAKLAAYGDTAVLMEKRLKP